MKHATRRPRPDLDEAGSVVASVRSVTALRPSRSGGPRWQVVTANAGTFVTEPDAPVAKVMGEYETGAEGGVVLLRLNASRRIVGAAHGAR